MLRRPGALLGPLGLLVQHRQSHGIPPGLVRYITTSAGWKPRDRVRERSTETAGPGGRRLDERPAWRRSNCGAPAGTPMSTSASDSELSGRGAGIVAQPELIERHPPAGHRAGRVRRRDHSAARFSTPRAASSASGECPQVLAAWEARLPAAARRLPAGALSSRRAARALQRDRLVGGGALRRRQQRSRATCWSAADGIRSTMRQQCLPDAGAALCRLCGLARADPRGGVPARHPSRTVRVHVVLPAARRAVPGLSGDRARTTTCGPAIAATTWSGTGRPTRRPNCGELLTDERGTRACDLDPAAADPARRDRRRCAPPPSGCWRRSSAPWCG